jgi:hypothetical protein
MLKAKIVSGEGHLALLLPIEQQVVLLSLADTRETIGDGPSFRRIWSRLFGMRRSNRLASPRLEALRVFCVLYRLDRHLIGQEKPDAILSLETMLAAAALIDSRSPASPSRDPLLSRMRRRFFPHS